MSNYESLHYQLPYPPLELEDFPQINLGEMKLLKSETTEECMSYDKFRDYMNGTVEDIFSLCSSSHENSIPLPMQEN